MNGFHLPSFLLNLSRCWRSAQGWRCSKLRDPANICVVGRSATRLTAAQAPRKFELHFQTSASRTDLCMQRACVLPAGRTTAVMHPQLVARRIAEERQLFSGLEVKLLVSGALDVLGCLLPGLVRVWCNDSIQQVPTLLGMEMGCALTSIPNACPPEQALQDSLLVLRLSLEAFFSASGLDYMLWHWRNSVPLHSLLCFAIPGLRAILQVPRPKTETC